MSISELFPAASPEIISVQKLTCRVASVHVVPEGSVESVVVADLHLDLEGVVGDRHHGIGRKAGGREPWYAKGAVMGNSRHVAIVSTEELAEIARRLQLDALPAEWIGSNLVIEGVPNLSFLPRGTRMFFPSGAALQVTEQNSSCRVAGAAIVARVQDRPELELGFPKAAKRLRGLVASVERAGTITAGETVTLRLPEQWVYRA